MINDTTTLPPFEVHVFFKVDGALDFDRDRFTDLDKAIEWARNHLALMKYPVAAIVYEQHTTEGKYSVYSSAKRFELRVADE